eukprot:5587523-Amphidinium_carterae.1
MSAKNPDDLELPLWRNFSALAEKAFRFRDLPLQTMEEFELNTYLDAFEQGGVELPVCVKSALLKRKTTSLLEKRDHSALLDIVDPWQTGATWQSKNPRVSDMECDEQEKLSSFVAVCMQ